jgi:hypothetical protein
MIISGMWQKTPTYRGKIPSLTLGYRKPNICAVATALIDYE